MSHTSFRQSAGFSFALLSAVICSCQSALNSDLVENLIHQEFQQNMPVALTSIECPEGMTSQNGVTYLCTGFAHGVKIDFEIHPSDRPNVFDWQIATMAFEGKTVEKVLEIALEGSYLIPISKVSCPFEIPMEAGQKVTCLAEVGSQQVPILVEPTGKPDASFKWSIFEGQVR